MSEMKKVPQLSCSHSADTPVYISFPTFFPSFPCGGLQCCLGGGAPAMGSQLSTIVTYLLRGPSGWSHIRHTPFLDTCFLIFLVTLFAAWLASAFVPKLYELKVPWTHNTSPTCDLCNAHDVQDEQHALFHCTQHMVSL